MKILHALQYPFDPDRIPGGVFSAGYHITHELAVMPGIEMSAVTVTKDVDKDLTRTDGAVPVTFLAQKRRRIVPNMISDVPRIAAVIEESKPDIVCAQLAVYGAAALRTGIPWVYLIHGVIHKEAKVRKRLKERLLYWLYVKTDRAAAKGAKHIIGTSQYVVEEYSAITNARFHVVDNAIDDRFFDVENKEEPARILLAGLVYDRKNILGAIEIIRRLKPRYPDIVLRIAGWIADKKYYQECVRSVKRYDLERNVEFLGMTPKESMLEELSRCAMLLLTSKQETAPLIISEAMAAGKPIVSADVGGCRYMVEDGGSGFVVPWDDTNAFVDRVGALLEDSSLRKKLGSRAREIAESRFRRGIVAANTLAVYKEVLGYWRAQP